MPITKFAGYLFTVSLLALGAARITSQEVIKPDTQIFQPSIPHSNPHSGEQMYKDYCASCHGPSGKGDGPVAAFMKTWPPDLTTMAQRNSRKYPEVKVRETLLFGTSTHAHGTSEMPVWGPLFRAEDQNKKLVTERISNLTLYIQSLQQK